MAQVKTVVFDIGNVLIRWDPENLYRKLIPDAEERRDFLSTVCTMAWNVEQDRGRGWEEAIALLLAQFPQHEALIRAYSERWEEMLDGQIDGSVALLKELGEATVPLYAITNFSSDKFVLAKELFPFLATSFIDTVVSGDEGQIKPDAAIYSILIERNCLNPQELVFIDDSLANVEGARAVGMRAIHFLSPEQVRGELKALGLPV